MVLVGLLTVAALGVAGWQLLLWRKVAQAEDKLRTRISQRVPGETSTAINCKQLLQVKPLVLLVLGQSNAGNHGSRYRTARERLHVQTDVGACFHSDDPLPGATGTGGSIWSRLPAALQAVGVSRPLVVGLLAVDATSMQDWAAPDSPLAALMEATADSMLKQGLAPDLVLWQHGESDARLNTPAPRYSQGLQVLVKRLKRVGVQAPWMLAKSTLCKAQASAALGDEIERLVQTQSDFLAGANTDQLSSAQHRRDGCHFTEAGLDAAAALWAYRIAAAQPQ
jgi:hypothetical protein